MICGVPSTAFYDTNRMRTISGSYTFKEKGEVDYTTLPPPTYSLRITWPSYLYFLLVLNPSTSSHPSVRSIHLTKPTCVSPSFLSYQVLRVRVEPNSFLTPYHRPRKRPPECSDVTSGEGHDYLSDWDDCTKIPEISRFL